MSLCHRHATGQDLVDFILKLVKQDVWTQYSKNPDKYLATQRAAVKIYFIRKLTGDPQFGFMANNWMDDRRFIAESGFIRQMEVRVMPGVDQPMYLLYIHVYGFKLPTVVELVKPDKFYSFCFPESHLKKIQQIEMSLESVQMDKTVLTTELKDLVQKYEKVLETVEKLQPVMTKDFDLGACYARLMSDDILDVDTCLRRIEGIKNSPDPSKHIAYISPPLPVIGDWVKNAKALNEDGKLDLDLSDPVQILGFLHTADNAIELVLTHNYGCVRLDPAIDLEPEVSERLFRITVSSNAVIRTQVLKLCAEVPVVSEELRAAIFAIVQKQAKEHWNWDLVGARISSVDQKLYAFVTISEPVIDLEESVTVTKEMNWSNFHEARAVSGLVQEIEKGPKWNPYPDNAGNLPIVKTDLDIREDSELELSRELVFRGSGTGLIHLELYSESGDLLSKETMQENPAVDWEIALDKDGGELAKNESYIAYAVVNGKPSAFAVSFRLNADNSVGDIQIRFNQLSPDYKRNMTTIVV